MTFRFFHSCTLICLALTGWAATEVQNHQVLQNLSGSQGSETHFFIQVPSGADTLTITISGGVGTQTCTCVKAVRQHVPNTIAGPT